MPHLDFIFFVLNKAKNVICLLLFLLYFVTAMSDVVPNRVIVEKLKAGMKFGLFGKKSNCYFRDGTKVRYADLWAAIKETRNLEQGHKKTLSELFPDTFVGVYPYHPFWHNWKKSPETKNISGP